MSKEERIDISKDMTDEFYKVAKYGQVLRFKQEDGTMQEFKISRLNRKSKVCIVKPWKTYTQDELSEKLEREENEKH